MVLLGFLLELDFLLSFEITTSPGYTSVICFSNYSSKQFVWPIAWPISTPHDVVETIQVSKIFFVDYFIAKHEYQPRFCYSCYIHNSISHILSEEGYYSLIHLILVICDRQILNLVRYQQLTIIISIRGLFRSPSWLRLCQPVAQIIKMILHLAEDFFSFCGEFFFMVSWLRWE